MLKIQTTPPENCEVLMTVEIDGQQEDKLMKAAARRISHKVQVRGFRPGKAPYNVVLRLVGEEAIRNEAMEDLTQSVFQDALKDAGLEPSAQASMEDVSWSPLVMKVKVPVAPVVELGDYRSMRMVIDPVEVTAAEVDEALARLQEERAEFKQVDRPAALGDRVTIDVKESEGGEVVGEQETLEFTLVDREADEDSSPDIVTPLVGISAGEERSFDVSYPDEHRDARYAGKTISISVRAHKVEEKKIFPLDDDFAQTVGDYDSLAALREKLGESLREQKQSKAEKDLADKALDEIVKTAIRVEWHKSLEDSMVERMMEDQDRQLRRNGFSMELYLTSQKKTREEWQDELRPDVRDRLRRRLVAETFAEQEGLSLEGKELIGHVDMLSTMAGEKQDDIRRYLLSEGNVERVASDLLMGKVRDRLVKIVTGTLEAEPAIPGSEAESAAAPETD